MKTMNLNLTVQNVRTFANADGRQFINLITVQQFPKRAADRETGEVVETNSNELVLSLKQFMHTVYLTPNFCQVYFKDFDRKHYTVMGDGDWYSLLLGSNILVTIERYEDGDSFVNEITGEEEVSDGVTYHTHVNAVKVADCGKFFALHKEDSLDAIAETIDKLQAIKPVVYKFDVQQIEKSAD